MISITFRLPSTFSDGFPAGALGRFRSRLANTGRTCLYEVVMEPIENLSLE